MSTLRAGVPVKIFSSASKGMTPTEAEKLAMVRAHLASLPEPTEAEIAAETRAEKAAWKRLDSQGRA